MSNHTLTSAKTIRAELQNRSASAIAQCNNLKELNDAQSVKIQQMRQAHELTEQRFIENSATLEQLQHSQAEIDAEIKKLSDLQRLFESAKKSATEIDSQIQRATQDLKIARRDFCVERSNGLLNEIKTDSKLRTRIIEAMAALAASNAGPYTYSATYFAQQYLTAIVPEISETEVRAAVDQYIKANDLHG